jgi:hypothetical protein
MADSESRHGGQLARNSGHAISAFRVWSVAVMRPVQESQEKLLHWLAEFGGVKRIWVKGLTDADMPFHAIVVRVLGGLADAASQLGLDVAPADDDKAFVAAGKEARALLFDGPANLEREWPEHFSPTSLHRWKPRSENCNLRRRITGHSPAAGAR